MNEPESNSSFIDVRFALEFAVAAISAVGAYSLRNHVFGLDTNGTGFLKLSIVAVAMTLWMIFRLVFRVRE
jgi:hypothetical protein